MEKVKEHIPIFLAMFVSLAALMTLLAMIEPRAFSLVPGAVPDSLFHANAGSSATADSASHSLELEAEHNGAGNAEVRRDSVAALPPGDRQTGTIAGRHDTVKLDSEKVAVVTSLDNGLKLLSGPVLGPDTLTEAERKKMVQIFEAMEVESAAKILMNMSDAVVKQVITTMKKRQSAKILAVLEPARAARILKEKL